MDAAIMTLRYLAIIFIIAWLYQNAPRLYQKAIWLFQRMSNQELNDNEPEDDLEETYGKRDIDSDIAAKLKSPDYVKVTEPRDTELVELRTELVKTKKERNTIKDHCLVQEQRLDILKKCLDARTRRLAWFEENYANAYIFHHEVVVPQSINTDEDIKKFSEYSSAAKAAFETVQERYERNKEDHETRGNQIKEDREEINKLQEVNERLKGNAIQADGEIDKHHRTQQVLHSRIMQLENKQQELINENESLKGRLGIRRTGGRRRAISLSSSRERLSDIVEDEAIARPPPALSRTPSSVGSIDAIDCPSRSATSHPRSGPPSAKFDSSDPLACMPEDQSMSESSHNAYESEASSFESRGNVVEPRRIRNSRQPESEGSIQRVGSVGSSVFGGSEVSSTDFVFGE